MTDAYRAELTARIAEVYAVSDTDNHQVRFPWLTGALGDPQSGIWFVGENPSLGQVERVRDPSGGPPTEEAQWWASRGDRLFRDLLVKHGFKDAPVDSPGGWHCYITNAIKRPDYAEQWRGSAVERQRAAADRWAPVLEWELFHSQPVLVVALGKKVVNVIRYLTERRIQFPHVEMIQHYSYVALRPRGSQGPMHPERVREYDAEFERVATIFAGLRNGT